MSKKLFRQADRRLSAAGILFALTVFRGADARFSPEGSGKVEWVLEAHGDCHRSHGKLTVTQELTGPLDAVAGQIGTGRAAELCLKGPVEVAAADACLPGSVLHADAAGVILLHKRGGEALADYARQAAAFMQQNYSRSISVEDAARQAGVSRSYLYRAFQAEFGCSPSVYLTRYRIQRACQLLRHSGLPVGAVATSVGFEDPFYFSRTFRREKGVSPTEYREKAP